LVYGTIGKQFATALPMQTAPPGSKRDNYWKALSTVDGSGEHLTWIMRPELAHALVETGLVDPARDGLALVPDVDIHASSFSAIEGRQKLVLHLRRERNRGLVAAKKASVESHACEICGFDSKATYGEDYCEVHHLTPLADLDAEAETTLDDLAIVCANCHRILHLQTPPLDMHELRQRLAR
jgi:5-methylcytosine-specific restriction protein A